MDCSYKWIALTNGLLLHMNYITRSLMEGNHNSQVSKTWNQKDLCFSSPGIERASHFFGLICLTSLRSHKAPSEPFERTAIIPCSRSANEEYHSAESSPAVVLVIMMPDHPIAAATCHTPIKELPMFRSAAVSSSLHKADSSEADNGMASWSSAQQNLKAVASWSSAFGKSSTKRSCSCSANSDSSSVMRACIDSYIRAPNKCMCEL